MKDLKGKLKFRRMLTFSVLFIGYFMYIFDRKSFAMNIPNIKLAETISSESIGSVVSSLAAGYAIGKFVGGVLVDHFSPKYLFSAGLVICGCINAAFSAATSTSAYASLWFVNGLFQGFGWPSCAKLLRSWYPPAVFGTLWSLLSASMNIAASVGPFFCNAVADNYGSWRYSMQAFGMLSFFAAALAFLILHDTPKDCGFLTNDIAKLSKHQDDAPASSCNIGSEKVNAPTETKENPTLISSLSRIVRSPFIYVMSLGFLAIIFCKGVVSDWCPLYLIEEKNATRAMASAFTGAVETGGLIGSVSSGIITDWMTSRALQHSKGHPRNAYLIPCLAILLSCMLALRTYIGNVNGQYSETLMLGFVIGFVLYGLISIVGVMTIERSAKDLSGTSHAVGALFGNIGLMLSGLPFTMIVKAYSWSMALVVVEISLLCWLVVACLSQFTVCRIGNAELKRE